MLLERIHLHGPKLGGKLHALMVVVNVVRKLKAILIHLFEFPVFLLNGVLHNLHEFRNYTKFLIFPDIILRRDSVGYTSSKGNILYGSLNRNIL